MSLVSVLGCGTLFFPIEEQLYYRRLAGEHPDWDDYRRAMAADRHALIRVTIERAGPHRQG